MARPLRVEYEDACYHVMNRGMGRQRIFRGEKYYFAFLETLGEAHSRFDLQIMCYCLMNNHYHLLVKTPKANLGRSMRHINAVYTQRYNRLRRTDGPLFRGRYKAIVVETDSYLLQLSRYIHRNPVEARNPADLDRFRWSSYPAYVNKAASPDWLYRDEVLDQVTTKRNRYKHYEAYVDDGIDEEMRTLYNRGNMMSVLGSDAFREQIFAQRENKEVTPDNKPAKSYLIHQIIEVVAREFDVPAESITQAKRGRSRKNLARWTAMYLCQEVEDYRLAEIAKMFGLSRYATVSTTIAKLKRLRQEDKSLARRIKRILLDLTP